jgi:hypothetical protein
MKTKKLSADQRVTLALQYIAVAKALMTRAGPSTDDRFFLLEQALHCAGNELYQAAGYVRERHQDYKEAEKAMEDEETKAGDAPESP